MSALMISNGDWTVCTSAWSVGSTQGTALRICYLWEGETKFIDLRVPMEAFVKVLDGRHVVDLRQLVYDHS